MRENLVSCANCGNIIEINLTKICRCGWKYEGNKKIEYAEIEEKSSPNSKPKRGKKRK